MIEIKFDSTNETILIQHLKELFTRNPILLQNIVEPCVNEMISDQNIPNQIKESIKLGVGLALTPDVIKTTLESALPEILSEQGTLKQVLEEKIDSNAGPIYEAIQDSIDSAVDDRIHANEIQEAISEKIDECINPSDIESSVEEAISNADIENKTTDAIREHIRSIDMDLAIKDTITDVVENNLDPLSIQSAAKEVVNSKFEIFTEAKVIELFKEFLATDPALKKLMEDQTVLPVMKKVTSPGMDILQIGIKPEATASFMWMIKGLMNEKTIEIQKVNGV